MCVWQYIVALYSTMLHGLVFKIRGNKYEYDDFLGVLTSNKENHDENGNSIDDNDKWQVKKKKKTESFFGSL